MSDSIQRRCSDCKRDLDLTSENFTRNRNKPLGFNYTCKKCMSQGKKHYYQSNRTRIIEEVQCYTEEHREEKNAYYKQRYQLKKDILLAQQRAYAQTEKAKAVTRISRRKYRQLEYVKEHRRAEVRNRRARQKAVPGSHTPQDIRIQYTRQKGKCYYCSKKLGTSYHVDHVVPTSRGGSNDPSNLVVTCHSCNESTNDKLPHEWPKGGHLF